MSNIKNIINYMLFQELRIQEEKPVDCEPSIAENKRDELWQKIAECPYEILPTAEKNLLVLLASSNISNNYNFSSDEIAARERFIFRYGSAAKVRLVPTKDKAYTGLFKTGAVGIIRLSLLCDPKVWERFVPAFELKLFIDDTSSLNMLAMDSLSNQCSSHNFFERILSNKPEIPADSTLKLAAWILSQTKNLPDPRYAIPMAQTEDNGKLCIKYNAPQQLYFVPTDKINQKIKEVDHKDFRNDSALLEPDEVLYQVMATDSTCIRAEHIADIILESSFVASAFCDQQLFFNYNL